MIEQIEEMVEQLGTAGSVSQMVEQEDAIAQMAGSGFMEGDIGYSDMESIKGNVEHIETGLREKFDRQKIHTRAANAR